MDKWRNVRLFLPSFILVHRTDTLDSCRYLKSIDKFHEWTVSAWLTPGGAFSPSFPLFFAVLSLVLSFQASRSCCYTS